VPDTQPKSKGHPVPITPYASRDAIESPDPSKRVADMAEDQAVSLVKSISDKSLVELTDMRDHIDTLMRALKSREDSLIKDIKSHAVLAIDVIGMKAIVRDSLGELIARVQPTPHTVTQRSNGNGREE
jgi:hypothetical protein